MNIEKVLNIVTIKKLLWASVVCLFINAITFPLMPLAIDLANKVESQKWLVAVGLAFWLSNLLGYTLLFMANRRRKDFVHRYLDGDSSMGCRAGLITFFSNVPGTIADLTFATMAVILLLDYGGGNIDNNGKYALLSTMVFSFNMHCILNGRIYKVIKHKGL